jgi:hypothetical protein
MTDISSEIKKHDSNGKFGRVFLLGIAGATLVLLIATVFVAVASSRGSVLSEYEKQAIEVVSTQNDITERWNQTVDMFNGAYVTSQSEHIVLFTAGLDVVQDLVTDSQSVINQWNELDPPDDKATSYQLGLQALMATQDGLILFEDYFQNSVDTLISDQIRADYAEAKMTHAKELWQAAAAAAVSEG